MEDSEKLLACTQCISINKNIRSLTYDECKLLSLAKTRNVYKKGQIIFNESNHPSGLYCIQRGKVKIYKLRLDGKEQIVRFAGDGDFIGYRSVLSQEPYRASAVAISDTYLCHIPSKSLFEFIEQNPKFAVQLIKNLAENLRDAERRLINISSMQAGARVASAILLLYNKFGVNSKGELNVHLTRKEIGELANATTETAIREISKLKKEGIISIKGKELILKKIDKLKEISEFI